MRVKKPSKKTIFFMMTLLPIFQPKLFTQYTVTTWLYIVMNCFVLVYYVMLFQKSRHGCSYLPIYWLVFRGYLLLIMVLHANLSGLLQWGYLTLMVLNLMLIFEFGYKNQLQELLLAICYVCMLLLSLNYLTLLIYDRGIIASTFYDIDTNDYYLLGIKTQFTTMMFPAIAASMAYHLQQKSEKSKLILAIMIILCLLNILHKMISTALIGAFVLLLLCIITKVWNLHWRFSWLFCFVILIHILVVFFDIQVIFSSFIETVLGKDATLSSRIYIWDSAKQVLSEEGTIRFLFGNGIVQHNAFVPFNGSYWQPHNQLLEWLYSNGVLGTILLFCFFQRCSLSNKTRCTSRNHQYILLICLIELILSVSEVYFDVAVCYVPFLILYYGRSRELIQRKGGMSLAAEDQKQ